MQDIENFLIELKKYGEENDIPNISLNNAKFLRDLIKIKKPKKMLEIGTANGFSAINFAIELKKFGGELITIEFSPSSANKAKENLEKFGLDDIVDIKVGNALDIIPDLNGKFDFIFIDGMKKRYIDFLELSRDLLSPGAVVIMDDVIKFAYKMPDLENYLIGKNINYNIIPIDKDDGVCMIVKDDF